jgi:hypothetical protein
MGTMVKQAVRSMYNEGLLIRAQDHIAAELPIEKAQHW